MNLLGKWENQNGSILEVTAIHEHNFNGSFVSMKGRAVRGTRYPVQGIVNGELVSFAVNFVDGDDNTASIATFSGRLQEEDEPKLHTVWIVARQFEDSEQTKSTQVWNTFLTNSDVFTRLGD